MTNKIIKIDPKMLALLRNSFEKSGLAKPFVKEIFLLQCDVAGTSYVDLKEIEKHLNINDLLMLQREPKNEYDELAILIHDQKGNKLGYVPRAKNEVLARLMDAGKIVFGKLESKEWVENWLRLGIRIYMRNL